MFFSTVVTYLSGLLIGKANEIESAEKSRRMKKLWVSISLIINLSILCLFKYYSPMLAPTADRIFNMLHIGITMPKIDLLLPVGISFYTFQALSYTMDVYRKDIEPVRHFGKYVLFVSFFPQLVAGPIERSKNLLPQFEKVQKFDYDRIKNGLLLMLWGFFEKIVIADRLSLLVDTVFDNYRNYNGFVLIIAVVFFAFQLLCDFSGYTNIAIGSAKVLGFELMQNFKRPFLSKSVAEFWRRWHISMSSWLRDYLYIPLGGSRKGKMRKCLNIIITFLASGFWHGASWSMVIFGFLNGFYQTVSIVCEPLRNKICKILRIDRSSFGHRLFQVLLTFSLFCTTLIFFRSGSISQAIYIAVHSLKLNPWIFTDGTLYTLGMDATEFFLSIALIIFYMMVQLVQRNKSIIELIGKQHIIVRWFVYLFSVMFVLTFGVYGKGYDLVQFIYFQF